MKRLLISLSLAVMLVAVMAVPAMADQDTGDTAITGDVPEVIDVTPPAGFAMPSLDPSVAQPISSALKTVSVQYNGTTGWTLTVKDSKATGNIGYMERTGPVPLINALNVKGGDITTAQDLTAERTLRTHSGSGGESISDVVFEQTVDWADAPGSYSITVTFTGTTP